MGIGWDWSGSGVVGRKVGRSGWRAEGGKLGVMVHNLLCIEFDRRIRKVQFPRPLESEKS